MRIVYMIKLCIIIMFVMICSTIFVIQSMLQCVVLTLCCEKQCIIVIYLAYLACAKSEIRRLNRISLLA